MHLVITNKKRALGILAVVAAVLTLVGGSLFFKYRSYFNQDRVIAQFPGDTIAYLYVREPHAFLSTLVVQQLLAEPMVSQWKDELLRQPFGVGIVPTPADSAVSFAVVVAFERTTGDQYALVKALEDAGFAVAENTKPLVHRTVVVVSPSSAAIARVRNVMALRERSLGDDYTAVIGLQDMSPFPAKITLNTMEPGDTLTLRAVSSALRLSGMKRATFGIRPSGEWLGLSTNPKDATRDFTVVYPEQAVMVFSSADDMPFSQALRGIQRTDETLYTRTLQAITAWEQKLGVSLEKDIAPYVIHPALSVLEGGLWSFSWQYPPSLSPEEAASAFSAPIQSLLSLAFPVERPLRLRDGSFGRELAKNGSIVAEREEFPDRIRVRWSIPQSNLPRQLDILPSTHEARFIQGDATPGMVVECGFSGSRKLETGAFLYNLANFTKKIIIIGTQEGGETYYSLCFQ